MIFDFKELHSIWQCIYCDKIHQRPTVDIYFKCPYCGEGGRPIDFFNRGAGYTRLPEHNGYPYLPKKERKK